MEREEKRVRENQSAVIGCHCCLALRMPVPAAANNIRLIIIYDLVVSVFN